MSATPPIAGVPPTPAATPPVGTPPAIAPTTAPPVISPPPAAEPPISAPPPVAPPPAAPPVVAEPPVVPPPFPLAPPPVVDVPPPVAPPPPVLAPPPVVYPPPAVSEPPPAVSPPLPATAPPPAETPPDGPPPPVSSPPEGNAPPPPSPPPPADAAPPTPGTRAPPPASISPPPVVLSPPAANRSPPPPPPAALGASTPAKSSTISAGAIVGIAAGGGLLALLTLVLLFVFCRKRKNKKNALPYAVAGGAGGGGGAAAAAAAYKAGGLDDPKVWAAGGNARLPPGSHGGAVPLPPEGSPSVGNSRSWFTYDELHLATNGFANENLLGEGGFGRVYKGKLPKGQVVAVKQLTIGGGQGDREFRAEVEIISRVHHRHLVSLVGYCIADKQRLLVYDFVPNGTLDVNLYGKGRPIMNWEMRVRVALGAARGLAYLHEDCHPRIIHRDIKSSNILLDDKYEAQVADFGLAKLASDTNTHVSTRVMGTFGYLAPEYAQSGKLTEKSDVYSFGVMLLELITGRKPIDQRNPAGQESLVEWARPLLAYAMEDGDLDDLVDPRLDGNYDSKEMFRMIEVAASCVRHTASKRPKMGQVVRALESEEENAGLYTGLRPGKSSEHESDFDRYAGSDYDTQAYNADMLRSRKAAGASTKSYGSEYTSEYTSGQIDRGSSSEFDPIIPKPGETRINIRESGPMSVRTGRSSMPSVRGGSSMESYTSLPPTRAAPPRPGQASDSDKSGSIRSDMFVPPPPPPNYSEEYAPIDFSTNIRDGR